MQSLLLRTGGRPYAYDDVEILQTLALGGTRLFADLPNCVVSGCQLTASGNTYDVAGGVLWLDGELRDFPGRTGVTLPALFQVGVEVKSDNRVHTLTTLNLPCVREQNAELVDYDPLNPPSRRPLLLTPNGPLMWWHRMQEKTRRKKEIRWVADLDNSEYDVNGLGVGAAWGWALADGRAGRVDLSDRFAIGRNPANPATDMVGKTGGEAQHTLTVPEMPSHRHRMTPTKADNQLGGGINDWTRLVAGNPSARSNDPGDTANFTEAVGGGQPHNNLPPFFTLAAWQWVGYE